MDYVYGLHCDECGLAMGLVVAGPGVHVFDGVRYVCCNCSVILDNPTDSIIAADAWNVNKPKSDNVTKTDS